MVVLGVEAELVIVELVAHRVSVDMAEHGTKTVNPLQQTAHRVEVAVDGRQQMEHFLLVVRAVLALFM